VRARAPSGADPGAGVDAVFSSTPRAAPPHIIQNAAVFCMTRQGRAIQNRYFVPGGLVICGGRGAGLYHQGRLAALSETRGDQCTAHRAHRARRASAGDPGERAAPSPAWRDDERSVSDARLRAGERSGASASEREPTGERERVQGWGGGFFTNFRTRKTVPSFFPVAVRKLSKNLLTTGSIRVIMLTERQGSEHSDSRAVSPTAPGICSLPASSAA
jgi:hypothetical protein